MREIKFRAWLNTEKRMIDWKDLLIEKDDEEGFFLWVKDDPNDNHSGATGESDFVLMQYTGLKDENSTEIYEGDVIEWLDPFGVTVRSQVIYDETTASYKTYKGELSHISIRPNLKVVGNIYENPELLEEKQ